MRGASAAWVKVGLVYEVQVLLWVYLKWRSRSDGMERMWVCGCGIAVRRFNIASSLARPRGGSCALPLFFDSRAAHGFSFSFKSAL